MEHSDKRQLPVVWIAVVALKGKVIGALEGEGKHILFVQCMELFEKLFVIYMNSNVICENGLFLTYSIKLISSKL